MKFFSRYQPDNRKKIRLAYEKIIQIVKAKLEKEQTDDIDAILDYLRTKFFTLIELGENGDKKFYELVFSEEIFENYEKTGEINFGYLSQNRFEGLNWFLGVFLRIWHEASKRGNTHIESQVLISIEAIVIRLLVTIEPKGEQNKTNFLSPYRGVFFEACFRMFHHSLNEGTKKPDFDDKSYLSRALFYWYLHAYFGENLFSPIRDDFDKAFFEGFKIIIQKNEQRLFEDFVKAVIHGHYYPSSSMHDLSYVIGTSYRGIADEKERDNFFLIKKKIVKFQSRFNNFFTQEMEAEEQKNLDSFQSQLSNYKKYLQLHPFQIDIESNFKGIKNALKKSLKYNNLLLSIVNVLSYAMFKKRYGMLKFIFEFHQPKDTTATWGGADILPVNPKSFFELLAHVSLAKDKIQFCWDNHSGPDLYTRYLMLLVLSRILKYRLRNKWHYDTGLGNIQSLNLKERQTIANEIENLLIYTGGFAKQTELLQVLNLDETWVQKHLVPCLNTILESTEESKLELLRSASINETKRENFKRFLFESFNENSVIRQLIRHFGGKDKAIFEKAPDSYFIRRNDFVPKARFIDDWNVSYIGYEQSIAKSIAISDNNRLIGDILSACVEVQNKTIKEWLLENGKKLSEYILIGINIRINEDLVQGFNDPDFEYANVLELPDKLNSFFGVFKKSLEVYLFHTQGSQKRIIILPKKIKGRLVQYSMKKPTEKGFEVFKNDIFYYELLFFSEDQKLLQKTVQDAPELIKDFKNPYLKLQEFGWLRVYLKSQFQKGEDFIGWFFNL